jgi:pimeloyl-ACP methyl ester carboxylesterase
MSISNSLTIFESGNSQGIPFVLVHGGAGGVWTWDETVKFLSDFHCLLPELPEHGSSQSNGPFTIASTAQSILHLIREHVPGGKAHIFGLSVGGQIVVEMLARSPETLLSAVISGAQLLPLPGYRLGIYSEHMMALIYWLGIHLWKHNDAWIHWNMRTSAGIPDTFFERFKRNFQNLTRDSWAHVMSENYRYRVPQGLEKANLPVLLIAGAHETSDIQPTNRLLRSLLPHSRSVLLDRNHAWSAAQEHNWPFNAPELCAQVIRNWVSGQPLQAELVNVF